MEKWNFNGPNNGEMALQNQTEIFQEQLSIEKLSVGIEGLVVSF